MVGGLGAGNVGGGNEVARCKPTGRAAAWVSGDRLASLARGEIKRDSQNGLGLDLELDWV